MGVFRTHRVFPPWVIVLTLQLAVVGSVSFWSGVESLGARYMLSNTPLVGLGLLTILTVSGMRARFGLALFCAACRVFTSLFAIQFRLNVIPSGSRLSELMTDKLRLDRAWRRKDAVKAAKQLLSENDPNAAIRILEGALTLGEDSTVDEYLVKSYQMAGNPEGAAAASLRYQRVLNSMLY